MSPLRAQQLDSVRYAHGYLYYHVYGKGEPVIVLSGGPGNSCMQQEEVAIRLGRAYRCILPEQRGTGLSIPQPFDSTTINLAAAIGDIERLMNHLQLRKAIVYGHSWGGMLAMSFAAAHPERVKALVLVSPGYYAITRENMATHIANQRVRYGLQELARLDSLGGKVEKGTATPADMAALDTLSRLSYIYNKQLIDSLLPKINAGGKRNALMTQLMVADLWRTHYNLAPVLHRYKGEIYLIAGRQDALAFYSYDLKILRPSIHLRWIQECGHFPMFEQAAAFYEQLFAVMKAIGRL
jgi:proline iminopeptidase